MISAIFPLLFTVVTAATPTPAPAASGAEPAISVTLNHASYDRGDRARVTVRVRDDGYVVVLHTDANGRVRVLFPVDPGDDNFLKAGQDYEIRGRGDRDAFQVTSTGSGTVYAAVSLDPFHPDEFNRNNHWDYQKLDSDSSSNDPEALMTNIVEQMAAGSHFDYDVATYTVEGTYASTQRAYIVPAGPSYSCFYGSWDPWCDGYYPSPSYYGGFSIGFGFGGFGGYRPYGYYPRYGFGYGYGYGYPYYGGGYYPRGGYSYGAAGYGYTVGHGWSYRNQPIHLGPGGGYTVGSHAGIGLGGSSIGYRNRGTFVSARPGVSPLYGVSRFNTQRAPSRGNDSFGRRTASGDQTGFRTRINDNARPAEMGGGRQPTRVQGSPTRVERSPTRVEGSPTRVERAPSRGGDSRPTRVEPRSEGRSSAPRAEPRSEGRSRPPESHGGGGGGERRGGGDGGGGGRRGGHPH